MTTVPLVDLAVQHAQVAEEVETGFAEVLAAADFIGGKPVAAFEQEYAEFVGARSCVGVANGTDALELALRALGVGHGDEVVVPANSFIATAEAVVRAGARPVFADVDDEALLLDPALVEEADHPTHPRRDPGRPVRAGGSLGGIRGCPGGAGDPRRRGRGPVAGCDPVRAIGRDVRSAGGDELLPGQEPRRLRRRRSGPHGRRRAGPARAPAGRTRQPVEVPAYARSASTRGWTPSRPWSSGRSCEGCPAGTRSGARQRPSTTGCSPRLRGCAGR